jgi:hypothetical protein
MSSNIRSLHFTNIVLPGKVLLAAICVPKALVQLSYGYRSLSRYGKAAEENLRAISQALLVHRDSLKSLRLDLRGYLETWGFLFPCGISEGYVEEDRAHVYDNEKVLYKHVDAQIGSLKDFSALEHLEMQVDLFLHLASGVPRFPEHNRRMKITTGKLSGFSLASSLPPKLKTLCIREIQSGSSEECIKQMRELCTFMSKNRLRQKIDIIFKPYNDEAPLFA